MALVALLPAQTAASVLMNQESGEFTSAMAAADAPRFWASILRFVAVLVVAVPLYASYYYVRDKLGPPWRRCSPSAPSPRSRATSAALEPCISTVTKSWAVLFMSRRMKRREALVKLAAGRPSLHSP